jgi:hypothetical protein
VIGYCIQGCFTGWTSKTAQVNEATAWYGTLFFLMFNENYLLIFGYVMTIIWP